jgi:SAM-dependent methyltransferase
MSEVGAFKPPNKIGEMLVSSRSLAEYRKMFLLTDQDLTKSIVDCPGGAASFTAEVNSTGGRVTACDPLYDGDAATIGELSFADMRRANNYQRENPDEYVWTFFANPDEYLVARTRAGELFIRHMTESPDDYVVAALPTLPFADQTFDLALSSHLLFAYLDRLDRDFHLDSIRELARVAAEVRVFPLVPFGFPHNPDLPGVIDELTGGGLRAELIAVDYELQRGADTMLRVVESGSVIKQ